jgi:multicomponent Na+:H+ antiporter subunit F
MIALAIAIAAALLLALTLVRVFAGPSLYDRAAAATSVVLKAALVCAAIAAMSGEVEAVDAAFVMVFAAFVLNAAVLKFFRARTFQAPLARAEERS